MDALYRHIARGTRSSTEALRLAGMPETTSVRSRRSWLLPLCGLAAAGLLCGCSQVLDPKGPIGAGNKIILLNSLAVMLAIVVPTIVATLGFAWWFRASNTKAQYRPDWAYSGRIELVVWSIPVLVILFLGGITYFGSYQLDPYKPIDSKTKALEVEVVSLDWKWLFIYPEQNVASVNQLFIPAGTPVHFSLTSASVMNSFFVPQLGSMIYTMNGMATQLNLQADEPGVFHGLSTHYSGAGFSDMHFEVHAVPADQFAGWVATAKGAGTALDAESYGALAEQSQNVQPFTYPSVQPGLYDRIVSQKIPPSGTREAHAAPASPQVPSPAMPMPAPAMPAMQNMRMEP